jgi:hypothetical protein
MGEMPPKAAHLTAHLNRHAVFSPGLSSVATSGTGSRKPDFSHRFPSPGSYPKILFFPTLSDADLGQFSPDQLIQQAGSGLLGVVPQVGTAFAAALRVLLHDIYQIQKGSVHEGCCAPKLLLKRTWTLCGFGNQPAARIAPGQASSAQTFPGHKRAGQWRTLHPTIIWLFQHITLLTGPLLTNEGLSLHDLLFPPSIVLSVLIAIRTTNGPTDHFGVFPSIAWVSGHRAHWFAGKVNRRDAQIISLVGLVG